MIDPEAAVDGAFGFVLAVRDETHGLSFWSKAYGFGPLFNATVFSESDAAAFDLPAAETEPEWLALPARLSAAD